MFTKDIKLNIISIIVLIIFVFLAVGSTDDNDSNSSPNKIEAMTMAQTFLEDRLKAPATADYPWESSDDVVTELADDKFRYRSYVDAENSFGAKVRTQFDIVVQYVGDDKWRLVSIDTW
ncbi:MAG: hypothetical protein ACOCRK_10960 [bacterium]